MKISVGVFLVFLRCSKRFWGATRFCWKWMFGLVERIQKPPTWDESKLLEGVYFCRGHSLFHDRHLKPHQRLKLGEALEKMLI